MNTLLSIFCYIISNVSNRKNLHKVQLMIERYPDRQNYSKEAMSLTYTRGMTCFVQSIWGNQAKIPRISQGCQNNQGHHPKFMITRGMSPMVKSSRGESFQSSY